MSSLSQYGESHQPQLPFEDIIQTFIHDKTLPSGTFTRDQINELANRVLLSGQATPEHFQRLQGVTHINFAQAPTPIPGRVLAEIFTQYRDSLEELIMGKVDENDQLDIPHSLRHLQVLHLEGSSPVIHLQKILLSAFGHAEEIGLGHEKKHTLDEETGAPPTSSAKRQKRVHEFSDAPGASNAENAIPLLDRIEAPPSESVHTPIRVKVTSLTQLELLSFPGMEHARIELDISEWKNIDNRIFQEIATTLGNQIVALNMRGVRHISLEGYCFPNLETLDVSNTLITDEVLQSICRNAPNLKRLDVGGCPQVTLVGVQVKELETLIASGTSIADNILCTIGANASKLKHLDVSGCRQVILGGFQGKELETLIASGTSITDNTLGIIAANAPNLKHLDVSACRGITLARVQGTRLERLVVFMTGITDDALRTIDANAPNLKHLDVGGCPQVTLAGFQGKGLERLCGFKTGITDDALRTIDANAPNLKYLDVRDCLQVTQQMQETLRQQRPYLQMYG